MEVQFFFLFFKYWKQSGQNGSAIFLIYCHPQIRSIYMSSKLIAYKIVALYLPWTVLRFRSKRPFVNRLIQTKFVGPFAYFSHLWGSFMASR